MKKLQVKTFSSFHLLTHLLQINIFPMFFISLICVLLFAQVDLSNFLDESPSQLVYQVDEIYSDPYLLESLSLDVEENLMLQYPEFSLATVNITSAVIKYKKISIHGKLKWLQILTTGLVLIDERRLAFSCKTLYQINKGANMFKKQICQLF